MTDQTFTTVPENADHIQKAALISNFIKSQQGAPEGAVAKMQSWFDRNTGELSHAETLELMNKKGMITIK